VSDQHVASSFKLARRHGVRKYVGEPCASCGEATPVRYTSSRACVVCASRRHAERRAVAKLAPTDPGLSRDNPTEDS
jgi:hypothetical protein